MIGIYLLKQEDKIVYVGQSIDIENRIKQHTKENIKKFDSYEVIECDKNVLDSSEAFYIMMFSPEYNIRKYEINTSNKTKVHEYKGDFKMIKVDSKVHEQAKKKADSKGMTLKGYIKLLIEKDK